MTENRLENRLMVNQLPKRVEKLLKIVLCDPHRKSIAQILFEYALMNFLNRNTAKLYFSKYLYHRRIEDITCYLLTVKLQNKCWKLNDSNYTSLLNNKRLFEIYFSTHGVKIIKSLAYNYNSLFFLNRKLIQIKSFNDFSKFVSNLFDEKSNLDSIFIKKMDGSYGGSNIYKIVHEDLYSDSKKINLYNVYDNIIKSNYLFQEGILQHERLNKMNPHCLNTIRIDTYASKSHSIRVMSSSIRFGINKSYVDNVSKGGMHIGVNVNDGTLKSEAYTAFDIGGGKTYKAHPETGIQFEGFEIPFYQNAKKLVIEAAKLVPNLKIIGWDVAIQPKGPILIEGNAKPGIYFSEIVQDGFGRNPVFMELFKEIVG